jgi:hypothetical protein
LAASEKILMEGVIQAIARNLGSHTIPVLSEAQCERIPGYLALLDNKNKLTKDKILVLGCVVYNENPEHHNDDSMSESSKSRIWTYLKGVHTRIRLYQATLQGVASKLISYSQGRTLR